MDPPKLDTTVCITWIMLSTLSIASGPQQRYQFNGRCFIHNKWRCPSFEPWIRPRPAPRASCIGKGWYLQLWQLFQYLNLKIVIKYTKRRILTLQLRAHAKINVAYKIYQNFPIFVHTSHSNITEARHLETECHKLCEVARFWLYLLFSITNFQWKQPLLRLLHICHG